MEMARCFWTFECGGVVLMQVLLGLIILILANYGMKRLLKTVRRRFVTDTHDWREKIDQIVYLPFQCALWIIGAFFVIDVVMAKFGYGAFVVHLRAFRNATVVLCGSWLLIRWKNALQYSVVAKKGLGRQMIEPGMVEILGRLSTICVVVIAAMIMLQILGIDVKPLIAFGGIGAAAIGFAGKDVIANFFGGLMLHITRPFTLGDAISLPEKNLEGTVEEIGWYLTSVRDKDKRPVYLPNALFSTLLVINGSRMSHRKFESKIGVRYEDFSKLGPLSQAIKEMMMDHPAMDRHLPMIVSFDSFEEYSLEIYIEAFTLATRLDQFYAVKQEILTKIYHLVIEHGAQMPLPTTAVELVPVSS